MEQQLLKAIMDDIALADNPALWAEKVRRRNRRAARRALGQGRYRFAPEAVAKIRERLYSK